MTTAAQDDEKARGGAAFSARRPGGMYSGEDVEQAELLGVRLGLTVSVGVTYKKGREEKHKGSEDVAWRRHDAAIARRI